MFGCASQPLIPQDHGEAYRWYKRAEEQGSAFAKFKVAEAMLWGLGTPQDQRGAMERFVHIVTARAMADPTTATAWGGSSGSGGGGGGGGDMAMAASAGAAWESGESGDDVNDDVNAQILESIHRYTITRPSMH